jgi:hypothetical protein
MYEWALLGLVAAAFYLLECCAWISRPCLACFRHPLTGGWRAAAAADLIGNDRGGVLLTSPFDFSGAVVQSCELPFTVNPDGVLTVAAGERDDQDPDYVAFEDIDTIRPVLETVLINERIGIKTSSAVAAAEITAFLETLKSARRRDRDKLIRSAIADRLSLGSIEERWKWFHGETRVLRLACMLSTAWLFVVAPVALVLFGPLASWLFLLAGLVLCGVVTASLCFRTHKRLFRVAASDRWVHALSMAFFPLAAFRACDRLSKDLMWRYDPIALVAAFCQPQSCAGVIRPIVFDLSRPIAAGQHADGAACRTWHHEVLRNQVSQMLRAVDGDPLVAPEREDTSMAAFCPRCHTQYSEGRAACSVCVDVPLEPFVAVAERRVMTS